MDHRSLQMFLAVARTQNVSQAAEQLNLSQSAVSKRLKLLEQETALPLFERVRGNKTFRLTPAGEQFVDMAERWVSIWRETQALAFGRPALSLSIGTLDSLSYNFLPTLYQTLSRHEPKLNLKVVTSHSLELYDLVDRREVDVAFSLLRLEQPNIVVEKFLTESMVGIRLASDEGETVDCVHPAELATEDELYVDWGPVFQLWHDQWWASCCPGRIFLDTAHLIFSFFSHARQWAIVPLSVANKAMQTGKYRMFRFSEGQPDRVCYKLTHKYPKPGAAESLKIFERHLQQLPQTL